MRQQRVWLAGLLISVGAAAIVTACRNPAATIVARGWFEATRSGATGTVAIYRTTDGGLILELAHLTVPDAPALEVRLVKTAPRAGSQSGFLVVGSLRGSQGDQSFQIPPDIDLERYRLVSIWSRTQGVSLATATMTPLSRGSTHP